MGNMFAGTAWFTTDRYKELMAIKGNEKDTSISLNIVLAQAIIESYCNRAFAQAALTEYYHGSRKCVLVQRPPIASSPAPQIWDDADRDYDSATLVATTDYGIDYNAGMVFIEYPTSAGVMSLKISYTGGYATIPDDILGACALLVSVLMREGPGGTLGISSRTMPNGSVIFTTDELPLPVKMILDKYRLPPTSLGPYTVGELV